MSPILRPLDNMSGSRQAKAEGELTLGELEALACTGLSGLLALLHPRITAHEALLLEATSQLAVDLDKSTGDGETDGTGLADEAATGGVDAQIILALQIRKLQGQEKGVLQAESGEILLERTLVDGDLAGAFTHLQARYRVLAAADGRDGFTHV